MKRRQVGERMSQALRRTTEAAWLPGVADYVSNADGGGVAGDWLGGHEHHGDDGNDGEVMV